MIAWRPVPWIAAVLGFFGGGLGLLYVQRPWYAAAYFVGSIGGVLAVLYAMLISDFGIGSVAVSSIGWVVGIACAIHAYRIARAASPVAERRWYSRWYGLAIFPVGFVVLTFLFRSFAYEPFNMPSGSMHPTIPEGSYLFVAKPGFGHCGAFGITAWPGEPVAPIARGDVIAHRLVMDPATTYLGRIVGLPGDRIRYVNHRLVINGRPVPTELGARDERYQYAVEHLDGKEVTIAFLLERAARDFDDVVPPDRYVVFGDSRDNARDSRYIGFIPRDHIVGRVVKVVKPREW